MKHAHIILLAFTMLILTACSENPVADNTSGDEDVTVSLSASTEHFSTLTDIEFEVQLTNDHGEQLTDIGSMQIEYQRSGDSEWEIITLERHEDHYSAQIMFMSSGEYQMRVSGDLHGEGHMDVMYTAPEMIDVERINAEMGDVMVEFETFPGHVHEGEEVQVSFYVMETAAGGGGHGGAMMSGLTGEIHIMGPDGAIYESVGDEHDLGVYSAHHTFLEGGEATFEFHFLDHHGDSIEVEFHVPVEHGH